MNAAPGSAPTTNIVVPASGHGAAHGRRVGDVEKVPAGASISLPSRGRAADQEELLAADGRRAGAGAELEAATMDRATQVPRHLGLALVVIAAAQLMIVLDATIVNVALPQMQRALGFSGAGLEWIVTAYSLAFGSLLLLGGRLGDLYGRRRIFITGVLVFSARLAGRRLRDLRVVAAHGARRAGRRRRAGRADRPRADRHDLPRGRAAQPGARRVGRHGRRRRRHRPAARRHPDHLRLVALGVLRQRAHRPDRGGARAVRPGRRRRGCAAGSTSPA